MLVVASSVLQLVALLLALPAGLLLVQVVAAKRRPERASDFAGSWPTTTPPFAVLMPAHDEAAGIGAAIATVTAQLRGGDRLVVIADNCSDETARVAAAAGAEVVVRHDPLRRGKGHALAFGVQAIAADAPAAVVVVDADCAVEPGSLLRLAATALHAQRPVQALYLMRSPAGAGMKARIGELAWIVRNQARPLGCLRLGWPCQLMGTGMAFPWPQLRDAPLASGHLVEDLQLGLALAGSGRPPLFCPEARVESFFPGDAAALAVQRTRWEHGHLSIIASVVPMLLRRIFRGGAPGFAAMALDACVPPLAALVAATCAVAALAAALALAGGSAAPLVTVAAELVAIAVAVLLAWQRFGRHTVSLMELLSAPWYVVAKLPLYARMLGKRQVAWVRTRRADKPADAP